MDSNKKKKGTVLKRSNLVVVESSAGRTGFSDRRDDLDSPISQPDAKKSKTTNRFDTLFGRVDEETENSKKPKNKSLNFLKPSKLESNASSLFLSVQQNNNDVTTVDQNSTNPSEKFLSLTRLSTVSISKASTVDSESAKNEENGDELSTLSGSTSETKVNVGESTTIGSTDITLKEIDASKSGKLGTTGHVFGGFSTTSTFTFGQNLDSRATTLSTENDLSQNKKDEADITSKAFGDCVKPPPMLFGEKNGHVDSEISSKIIPQSHCKTGEENELTVFQMSAKLFQYDSEVKNWKERGQGILKVNEESKDKDSNVPASVRVVMRTNATFQLILNCKLFAGQIIEKASEKAIKLSSLTENQSGMTLYTIKGNPQSIDSLYSLLHMRAALQKDKGCSQNDNGDFKNEIK